MNLKIKKLVFWGLILTGITVSVNIVFGAPTTTTGDAIYRYIWDDTNKVFSADTNFVGGAPTTTRGTKTLNYCWDDTNKQWTACDSSGGGTVTSIATTYPITGGTITTSGTLDLAFGTTTPNTWSDLQTFTSGISVSSDTITDFAGLGLTVAGGDLNCDTADTSTFGCLTASDFITFNNKISSQWTTTGSDIYYNSGNVGIGTTEPSQLLTLSSATVNTYLAIENTNAGDIDNWSLRSGTSGFFVRNEKDGRDDFNISNTGDVIFNGGGNVGIGTTTPSSALAVSGGLSVGADYNNIAPTNGVIIQGNLGIGTTTPLSTLDVYGNGIFSGLTNNSRYLNFGDIVGETGYGLRNRLGVIETKDNGDTNWQAVGTICPATMVDTDGNVYDVVKIGNQCWMAENLNVGTRIDGVDEMADTGTIEKYCYGDDEANCTTDGGLYQWDEMMQYTETEGTQGICSTGWHIPTDAEQHTLDQYLTAEGGTCDADRSNVWDCAPAGTALKESGSSGFEAVLSGRRDANGAFINSGAHTYFWSSSVSGANAWTHHLTSSHSTVYRYPYVQAYGFSVRCLKDTDDSTLWLFDSLANISDTNVIADSDGDSDGNILFRIGTTTKMMVNNTGNVGIGTTAPLGKLIVKGAGTGTGIGFQTQNSSGTAKVTMLDNGNLGIGTTEPDELLHVKGATSAYIYVEDGNSAVEKKIKFIGSSDDNLFLGRADDDGDNRVRQMTIQNNGNVGIGTTGPNSLLQVGDGTAHPEFRIYGNGSDIGGIRYASQYIDTWGNLRFGGDYTSAMFTGHLLVGSNKAMILGSSGQFYFQYNSAGDRLDIYDTRLGVGTGITLNNGNVGIGTTNPIYKLDVAGTGRFTGALTLDTDLTVANGGSGASTFTDHGVLVGAGASAFTALTVGTDGQLLIGDSANDPVFATLNCADSLTCTTGAGTLEIDVDDDFLRLGGDIASAGTYDFGTASVILEIPNAAAPSVAADGVLAHDTTDNQLILGADANVIRTDEAIFGFTLASTSPEWFSGGSLPVPLEKDGYTITSYSCYVTTATSVVLTPSGATQGDLDAITCATTATTDTTMTATSVILADELVQMKIGTITGAPDYVSFTAFGEWTRE